MSEGDLRVLFYALTILGGLAGGLTGRSIAELARAPYFALSCLVFLVSGVVSYTSVPFIIPAMTGGYFWVPVAATLAVPLVNGFFIARISKSRSRDAYGHAKWAALAFIPFANLWLWLTPSKNEISANRVPTIPLLSSGLGVVSGFVMLIGGIAFQAYSEIAITQLVEDAMASGELTAFNRSPADMAVAMAASIEAPMVVDELTTLVRMEANGTVLRYVYELSGEQTQLNGSAVTMIIQQNCNFEPLTPYIQDGLILEHLYLRMDGSEIGTVAVTKEICGF
jgi:hypothetical protein